MKICFKCNIEKELTEFYKHPEMPDGTVNKCKECNKKENKENWHKNAEQKKAYDTNRWRYSIKRIFNSKYVALVRRSIKVLKCKHSAYGKEYLSKPEFIEWCNEEINYNKFIELYNTWVESDFERKLSPSIDRINSNLGYIKSNIQWLTLSENCKKYNK